MNKINFQFSPDQDAPGNKQIVVFDVNEIYVSEGNTHGFLSHAIKHYEEFDANGMDILINDTIEFLKSRNELYLKTLSGTLLAKGEEVYAKLTPNAIQNTYDLINDKKASGIDLKLDEIEIHTRFLEPLLENYNKLINKYLNNHIEINNHSEMDVKSSFENGHTIKFTGTYEGSLYTYILDTSNSGLLVQDTNSGICTLFRIDKQGNNLDEIKGYFERQVLITENGLRIYNII